MQITATGTNEAIDHIHRKGVLACPTVPMNMASWRHSRSVNVIVRFFVFSFCVNFTIFHLAISRCGDSQIHFQTTGNSDASWTGTLSNVALKSFLYNVSFRRMR
jgi:hypothetical protein